MAGRTEDVERRLNWRVGLLLGLAAVAVVAALLHDAWPQDVGYHNFADQREFWRVPNFWNVVTNGPFVLAGLYGLWIWPNAVWADNRDRWPWLLIAIAAILIGFGSGYYHWHPDNHTLFWDRLPMTLAFMGLFAAAIAERVHTGWGFFLFGPFVLLGIFSVEYWRELDDLRFYILVQFYPMVALPLVLLLFPSRYTHGRMLWWLALLYGLAKIAEGFDRQIFAATGYLISGHSIKHVLAALGLVVAMEMIRRRKPLLHWNRSGDVAQLDRAAAS